MEMSTAASKSWPTVELGKIAKFINGDRGKNYPSQKDFVDDGVAFINTGHIQNGEISHDSMNFITRDRFDILNSGKVEQNDILYCLRGSLGKTAIVKGISRGAVASSLVIIRPGKDVRTDYLYRYLSSSIGQAQIKKFDNGSSQPNLSAKSVKAYKIPLPPVEEQRRIAAILDKADAVRRDRKQAIQYTDDLLRSAFLDIFGDPVTNSKGWKVVKINDIAKVTDGTHKTPKYVETGVPFLSAKNIRAHKIDWKDTRFIDRSEHDALIRRCFPEEGDVVLTKSGTIGEAAVIDQTLDFSLFESVALLKLKQGTIHPMFLATFLNEPRVKMLYRSRVKGVAVKHLHLIDIRQLPIFLPPEEKQQDFLNITDSLRRNKRSLFKALEHSENLFNSLLQRAFKGEL